jgi:hypothetical protein
MKTLVSMDRAAAAPANRSNTAAPGNAQERQLAWQREMERVQLSDWFKPNPASRDGAAAPQRTSPTRNPDAHRSDTQGSPPLMPVKRALFSNTLASTFSTVMSEQASDRAPRGPASGQPVAARVLPRSEAGDIPILYGAPTTVPLVDGRSFAKALPDNAAIRIDAAESRPRLPTASGEPPPILRLHAEPRPEGQAVWIAMRANDDAMRAMLPGIVADLQRVLRERGERLHLVVCNGRPVWQGGTALAHGDNVFDSFHTREI